MKRFEILPQPDDSTCGPTCLHAVYRWYGDDLPLERVIAEVPQLDVGGTLGCLLGCHALERGYGATLYTYNLRVFDPTWFAPGAPRLAERLRTQAEVKGAQRKLALASGAYVRYLELGGAVKLEDPTPALLRRHLKRGQPILTGLSATFLYRAKREVPVTNQDDDVRGEPVGHFVVLCGYDADERAVRVADPLRDNPLGGGEHGDAHSYEVPIDRALAAVLLGVLTYDANMLVIEPQAHAQRTP